MIKLAVLEEHRKAILQETEGNQRINICRSSLFQDTMESFSGKIFKPRLKLKVRFIGEPAVDEGRAQKGAILVILPSYGR